MIVTVTPNPSIDRTLVIDSLARGHLVRARASTVDPGGKGVNVSMALARNGCPTTAVIPAGGAEGDHLVGLLDSPDLELVTVPIGSPIRSNISLVEPDGVITKLNEPGPVLSEGEVDALLDATITRSQGAEWVVGCGSLPRDVDDTFYASLVGAVSSPVAIDTTGQALLNAVDAGVTLIKPNLAELAEATGCSPRTIGDVVEVAKQLRQRGVSHVLVSMGEDGALLVGETVLHGEARVEHVVSAVGAGDALLSGFLASGRVGRDALKTGLAWASACCELANTQMPTSDSIARQDVVVHDHVDLSRPVHLDREKLTKPGEESICAR